MESSVDSCNAHIKEDCNLTEKQLKLVSVIKNKIRRFI